MIAYILIVNAVLFVFIGSIALCCGAPSYMDQLEKIKAGKTIIRTSDTSCEVCIFENERVAIEHPQEVTFDQNKHPIRHQETVLLLKYPKTPIEVYNGENFVKISKSNLLTIKDGDKKAYLYLRLSEVEIHSKC